MVSRRSSRSSYSGDDTGTPGIRGNEENLTFPWLSLMVENRNRFLILAECAGFSGWAKLVVVIRRLGSFCLNRACNRNPSANPPILNGRAQNQQRNKKKKIRYIGPVSKKVKDIIGFSYYSSSDYRNFSSLICGNNCFFRFKQIKERKFRFKHSPDRLLEHSKQPKVVLSGGANVQSRGSIDPSVRCWTDFYGRVSLRMYMYITIYNMHVINLQHQHPFEHGFLRRHQLVSQIIDKCIKETTIINVPMEKNTNSIYVMLQTYLRKDTHIDVYIN
ncbi:hypothetical protein YC2023_063694 [Brassica napus]